MALSIMYRVLIAAAGLHRYQCESYTSQDQNYLLQDTRILEMSMTMFSMMFEEFLDRAAEGGSCRQGSSCHGESSGRSLWQGRGSTHGMDDSSLNGMQVKLDMVGLCLVFVVFWTS